ncbi:MAG: TrmH family RNA methyltransferase [Candidatus Levyibacteriota bacterium]
MQKLKPIVLRNSTPTKKEILKIKRNKIYIILDNIMDTYNTGAIFRLADAVAAEKVILCGETETPPNTRIKKASINTTEWVPWEYSKSAKIAIKNLRSKVKNLLVVAIEQNEKSVSFQKTEYMFPIAFVVGHETRGVSEEALKASDKIVELPMYGVNTSLNVMVSLGIVLYEAVKYL